METLVFVVNYQNRLCGLAPIVYVHLRADHMGGSFLATDASGQPIPNSAVNYYAYGSVRSGSTTALPTDRTFTGQEQDGTGLMYFRARYVDPALGTFISPDTLVPSLGTVIDYNRFAYSRANPKT